MSDNEQYREVNTVLVKEERWYMIWKKPAILVSLFMLVCTLVTLAINVKKDSVTKQEKQVTTQINQVVLKMKVDSLAIEFKIEKDKETQFKEDVGITLNNIVEKLDTLLDGQKKQQRFNVKIARGNQRLQENLEDIFGVKRSANNN